MLSSFVHPFSLDSPIICQGIFEDGMCDMTCIASMHVKTKLIYCHQPSGLVVVLPPALRSGCSSATSSQVWL